jgi:aspartate aminotransferase
MAGMISARAVLNPGDIAAMSELAYPGHYAGVLMNGGHLIPFHVKQHDSYHHNPDQMREVLDRYQPRLIWVCNPGNPSGLVYREDEAAPIIEHMVSHPNCVLIQDIIYKDLAYDNSHSQMVVFSRNPQIASRVITNDGASKGPRATGLRIGFVVVPEGQASLLQNIADQANADFAGVSPLTSKGIIPAFTPEGDHDTASFRDSLQNKRDTVISMINVIPGLSAPIPQGAFYALINIAGTGMNAGQFYNFALDHGVSVVPAGYFGATIPDINGNPFLREEIANSTVRWSFGGPLEPQIQGLRRLYEALSKEG